MTETPLDRAHAGMQAAPEDGAARLVFYDRLAEAELFLLLRAEAEGDRLDPEIFETEDGRFVLAFDRADRLAAFAQGVAPYAALSGRALAAMLAGQATGLGLNFGAGSEILLPADAMRWLAETAGAGPAEATERPLEVRAPHGIPEALLRAIDAKLAAAGGLARLAYLVGVTYAPNRPGHLLAFVDARPGAERALGRAISEALIFSGLEAGELDVGFFAAADPLAARLARVGLRIDMPPAERASVRAATAAPGSDPTRPPRLR